MARSDTQAEVPFLRRRARLSGAEVVVERVSRTYDGRIRVLSDVSLRLQPGEFAALTGPSGCGKTTLLNLIGALDRPDEGVIRVDGEPLRLLKDSARYRRDTVGYVFQLHNLLPTLSAEANIEIPLIAAGMSARARRKRAQELLAEVALSRRGDHFPPELSGGERQRVAVARAVANRPRLLLADEPTGSLDDEAGSRVLDLLAGLRGRHGMTVLMVSYDSALGARADRVLRMVDGRIVEGGRLATAERAPRPDAAA